MPTKPFSSAEVAVQNRPARFDARFSLLKVLGSIGVVIVHASAQRVSNVDTESLGWWIANISNAAGRFGSAIFVMVGGAVLLARNSEDQPARFARERLARLMPALLFWSVFYLGWREWRWGGLTWSGVAKDMVLGMPWFHLWFLYMLLGLYLLTPVLRMVVRTPQHGRTQYFGLAVCVVFTWAEATAQTLQHTLHASFVGLAPLFIAYFVGGYLVYRDRPTVAPLALWAAAVLAVAAMAIGVADLQPMMGDGAFALFYSNRGPFAMLLTFSLFLGILRVADNSRLLRLTAPLAPLTLGIYAIHPFWIDTLGLLGWGPADFGSRWILPAVAVYLLSAISAWSISQIPGLRPVVEMGRPRIPQGVNPPARQGSSKPKGSAP